VGKGVAIEVAMSSRCSHSSTSRNSNRGSWLAVIEFGSGGLSIAFKLPQGILFFSAWERSYQEERRDYLSNAYKSSKLCHVVLI